MDDQLGFSPDAHRVLAAAQLEAARLKHEYLGTEHLLLGLARDREGPASGILRNLGVDGNTIPSTVESMIPPGKDSTGETPYRPYTTRARQALELAQRQAAGLSHSWVGPEHLLLGLLAEAHGPGGQILTRLGVTGDAVRREMMRLQAASSPKP